MARYGLSSPHGGGAGGFQRSGKTLGYRHRGDLVPQHRVTRLDARFANPERWPGYYLVRQRAIASAVEKGGRRPAPHLRRSPGGSTPLGGSERLLTARSGRLAGRPDQFDRNTVTEYKSALPDPDWAEAASIIDGYWRQLRLYSVLIGETGSWPATARIVAASGQVLEEPVNRPACEAEADAAISGLDAMNQAV